MRCALALSVLLCVLTLAAEVYPQVNTADITGTVSDQGGGVVAGATVTANNRATGLERNAVSGETGDYRVALLPPGEYEVRVEAPGFSPVLQRVALVVGQRQTLNFTLRVGGVTEAVTVESAPPLIETTRSELGAALTPVEVKELPILDRNLASLTYTVPGVRPAEGFDPTKTRVGNFSLNGGDGRQVDIAVDGGDNKDNVVGGMLQNFTLEGIREFSVVTNRYTAESGRTVAAIVNVVTKSGTDSFDGSVFGLFQNSTFNKQDHFSKQAGQPKPVFKRYHFGGSAGGPIVQQKLFFFAAYEHKREPGNIPVEPTALSELQLFPLAEPVTQLPFGFRQHLLSARVDHQISDRQSMYYRYGRERWTQPNDQLSAPFLSDASGATSNVNQFHDFVIGHSFTWAGNKVNSFNLHFQDFVNQISPDPGRTFELPVADGKTATNPNICFVECSSGTAEIGQNVNVPQQTLIRKYQLRDDFAWTQGRHNLKVGVNYVYNAKTGGFFSFGANGYQITFADVPSAIVGLPEGFATPGAVSLLEFSGGEGSFMQRPHQLALYMQDDFRVTSGLTLNLGVRWDANVNFLPALLSDSPETSNRVYTLLTQAVAANPTAPGTEEGMARIRDLAGDTERLRRTTANWKEFQPRIGFAWDVTGSGKHVIRGGYGIAFDQVFQNLTLFTLQLNNPTIYTTTLSLSGTDLAGFRFGVDPLPAPPPPSGVLPVGATVRVNDPRLTDPYAQQSSIGWAWEFAPDWVFSADYYHVLGLKEPRVLNANPRILPVCGDPAVWPNANPSDPRCVNGANTRFLDAAFAAVPELGVNRIGEIRLFTSTSRSRYDGANFVLRKRFTRNYLVQAYYTLAKSQSWGGLPLASYGGTALRITPEQQFAPGEFGPTIFDERHRFVLSGHFQLPAGFEISPIFQAASARPYSIQAGLDNDGDGVTTQNDRACAGSTRTDRIIPTTGPRACQLVEVNSLRADPFAQLDVRFAKAFRFAEQASLRLYWEFYNLFDTDNFGNNVQKNGQLPTFGEPLGYFGGQGFGPATTGPLRSQFGLRLEW